jgi:hypothetical protein
LRPPRSSIDQVDDLRHAATLRELRESDCRLVGDCIHPVIESRHNGGIHGPVARLSGGVAGGIEEET